MKKQHIPLLETLQKAKGCVYLSDLRFLPLAEIQPEIEKLRPEAFSLHEWEDASGKDLSKRRRSPQLFTA